MATTPWQQSNDTMAMATMATWQWQHDNRNMAMNTWEWQHGTLQQWQNA
jgi:hypothetical protein